MGCCQLPFHDLRTEKQTVRFVGSSGNKSAKTVKIHYFCHPLYNEEVNFLYRIKRDGHYYYIIMLFDNSRVYLPEWMTDLFVCKTHELKEKPVCSLDALSSLHKFLKRL